MATNFNPATKISVSGPLSISDKRSADMPLDIRGRIETLTDITTIPFAWEGMLVYVRDTKKYYKVTSLANRTVGGVAIPYYPATWVEFGSGGGTPSPTPSEIDAGDVSYFSSGTFSNNTVGKELQSLASDILSLAEDIHNLSGDIGTLSNLNTENKQDLVAAINEVLTSTGSTITVVNNLLSNSTTDALSAYQGKVLKGLVDGKVAGIKVQGESSVLPMDGNGIVTIPAGGGGGTGTITGATVGGNPVTAIGGILQFDAYPIVPIIGINDANGNSLTPVEGIITLPQASAAGITGVKQGNTPLTPDPDGVVTVTDFTPDINDIKNTLQQIANSEPIVVPSTAINLPTSGTFNYDSGNTYVMNVDSTQIATIHYPYTVGSTDYVAFKAIDRDLYYVYSVASNGITYTYSNQYTWSTLPASAKSKFESGIYAVKQTINNDGSIPEGHWVHGVPSAFVTRHNYPLRYRQITETVGGSTIYYILIKNDEINKIYKYQASTQNNVSIWSQVTGGCYTKGDSTTGTNYNKYDKFFDRPDASNVDFDNTNVDLSSTNTQDAIVEIYNKLGFEIKTTNSITNPTKNTYYDLTASAISALDITNVSISNTNELVILFLASSSCTLTALATQRVLGSTAFANNTVYIMSIVRGVACIVEAPLYVVPEEEEQEEE